jgi:serine protease Do
MEGEVVGIVSHILTQSGGFEGVGFAIAGNVAQRVLLTAKSFWTGMDAVLLQDTLAQVFNLPQPAGLLVQQVAVGSPAAFLGLRPGSWHAKIGTEELLVGGDIILDVAGIAVTPNGASYDQMQDMLSRLQPGDSVTAKVLRGGKIVRLAAVRPPGR